MSNYQNWGLCCISKTLAEDNIRFKSMTFKTFMIFDSFDVALSELSDRILHNFETTYKTMRFCVTNNIKGYRMSSSLCPLLTHKSVNLKIVDLPNFDKIQIVINKIKNYLAINPLRISAHPSEYISLSSENDLVIENSVRDLEMHAEFFDLLDLPKDYTSPMNIHVRKEGDLQKITDAVMFNFEKLSDSVKTRLVLENNDNKKGIWNVETLVKQFSIPFGIPITFDFLHNKILPSNLSEKDAFFLAKSTWHDTVPIFHYSEGVMKDGVETRKHKDSPDFYPEVYDSKVFLDVELKDKCRAIFKLQNHEN